MSVDKARQPPPPSAESTRGLLWLAVLVLSVAAWLLASRSEPVSAPFAAVPGLSSSIGPTDPTRWRADAWFLPDEPLLGFVQIPDGPFVMGSDPTVDRGAYDNERWSASQPQGTVDLPVYYLARYEVTVGQFRAFVDATSREVDPRALGAPVDHPVVHVSWPDALAYGRWLTQALIEWSGTPPELRQHLAAGWWITLPTEAQWEKAARDGDGRVYPWGDTPRRDQATYDSDLTTPVGSHVCTRCPFGLADMSGNVWELTRSPYRPYPYEDAPEPADLASDALWVMRGGAFGEPAQNVRAAIRGGADPGARRAFIGFRVALVPPPAATVRRVSGAGE